MSKSYQKDRDEAAEKYAYNQHPEPNTTLHSRSLLDFRAGADWSQARAEKRIQTLTKQLQIAREALEFFKGWEKDTGFNSETGLDIATEALTKIDELEGEKK